MPSLDTFFVLYNLQSGALKRFIPLMDRVLIQRVEAATKSKGGILIPEKAQGKVNEGTVVAVGQGLRSEHTGQLFPMSVQVGDRVMLPEYGGTKIELDEKEFTLLRESDIVAKLSSE
eukprot:maker-scaffold1550_size36032-snap-gene-0.16 protein:Tk04341 transcript:maker-scaffold1550_size36032-snap-gene-0.16-mRNA-1 annotation:"heat shock protein 10"